MTNRTTDPRARQLAEAVHRLAREKATKLPAWQDLPISEREKATAEARLWLRAAVEAGIAPPTVAPDGTSVTPGARVSPVQPSSVSESAQSPTGAPEGAPRPSLPAEEFTGTQPCGHDDYHDPHPWDDRPGVWCPGHSYDDDQAATAEETGR